MPSCFMHYKMVVTFESMDKIRQVELFWEFEMVDAFLFVIDFFFTSTLFLFATERGTVTQWITGNREERFSCEGKTKKWK